MLDIKRRFTCGDSDLSKIIKKCQNIMTRIVDYYQHRVHVRVTLRGATRRKIRKLGNF